MKIYKMIDNKKPRWMRMTYQWNRRLENSRRKNIFKDLWLFLIFVHVHLCVHMYSWEQVHLQAKDFISPWSYTSSWFLWTQPISHSKNSILFLSMHKFILLFFCCSTKPMANTTIQPYLWSTSLWFSIHNTDNLKIKTANIINKVSNSNTKFNYKVMEKTVECDKERNKKRWRDIKFKS